MGLYTSVVSSLLFPLHERMKRHDSVAVRRELEASQWWSAERINALQVERLRVLLREVGTRVPYYRELFVAQGFDPAGVRSVEDLRRLPFLTKAVIRSNIEALKHTEARSLARFGVTSFSIVRDRRTLGVVLEGWAFDPSASSPAAAGALFGDRSAVRVLGPVARVAVEPASEIAS